MQTFYALSSRSPKSSTSPARPKRCKLINRRSRGRWPGWSRRSGSCCSSAIGRNIRLTQAGRRLVGRAERILDDLRDAIAEAEGAVAAESGRVCVAFLHTVGARWLPERLARFLESYPAVRFTLEEGTTAEVMSGVLGGDYDLGILGPRPRALLISRSIPSSASALPSWSRSTTASSAGAPAPSRTSPASRSSCPDPEAGSGGSSMRRLRPRG